MPATMFEQLEVGDWFTALGKHWEKTGEALAVNVEDQDESFQFHGRASIEPFEGPKHEEVRLQDEVQGQDDEVEVHEDEVEQEEVSQLPSPEVDGESK